jgi:hypothetical protein
MDTHQQYHQWFNKIQEYLIYLLILTLPLTHKEAFSIFQPDLVWSKFVLAACALFGVIIFVKNIKLYLKNIYFRLLSVYLGFQLLSLFRSKDLENSFLFIGFFTSVLFLFVFIHDFLRRNSIEKLIKGYLVSLIFVLGFLVRQIYLQETFHDATGGVWPVPGYPTRYGSTFWDVNHFGIYLVSLFLLLLGYLLDKYKMHTASKTVFEKLSPLRSRLLVLALRLKRLKPSVSYQFIDKRLIFIIILYLGAILYAFKLTGSRSSLLGLLTGLTFLFIGYFFLKKKLTDVFINYRSLTVISLGLLLPIVLLILFKEDIRGAFLYRAVSFYAHLFLLKVGILTGIENFFLGIGVNAFSEYFKTSIWAESYYYIDKAALNLKLPLHNLWLEAWVETGVFSFAFFAALWGISVTDLFKIYKRNIDYIALGLSAGILAFLVGGLFYSYKSEFFWLYAVIGFAYASIKAEQHLDINFSAFKSIKSWIGLICGLSLVFPLLFFTMPPALAEIDNYYYAPVENNFFSLWLLLLENFRYVIGNYSFTGRMLMAMLYLSAIFSSLSVLRKINLSFFTGLLTTTLVFLTWNLFNPAIMISYNSFVFYSFIVFLNILISLTPIQRKAITSLRRRPPYVFELLIIALLPFSVASSIERYDSTYDTNINFLIELAANRSKTNDAEIFVQEDSLIPLVQYYADRVEDDESGVFYIVPSTIRPIENFSCERTPLLAGLKYLLLVESSYECPKLAEGMPHVSVIDQGGYKLIIYEEKIRSVQVTPAVEVETNNRVE